MNDPTKEAQTFAYDVLKDRAITEVAERVLREIETADNVEYARELARCARNLVKAILGAALVLTLFIGCGPSWGIQEQPIWAPYTTVKHPTPIKLYASKSMMSGTRAAAALWNRAAGCTIFELAHEWEFDEDTVVVWIESVPGRDLSGIWKSRGLTNSYKIRIKEYFVDERYRVMVYLLGKVLGLADDPYGAMRPDYPSWIRSADPLMKSDPKVIFPRVNDGDALALRERYCNG